FAMPLVAGLLILAAVLMPTDPYNSGFVLFYGVAMIALAEALRRAHGREPAVPLIAFALVLLAGWCASLSFAYQAPILAIGLVGPLVAAVVGMRPTRFDTAAAVTALAVVAAVSLFINVELTYRDAPR